MPLSPTAARQLCRAICTQRHLYRRARRTALDVKHATYAHPGQRRLARERAIQTALEARSWLFTLTRRLATAEVAPFGGRLSPRAMARHADRRGV
jgi:hypothetical protein